MSDSPKRHITSPIETTLDMEYTGTDVGFEDYNVYRPKTTFRHGKEAPSGSGSHYEPPRVPQWTEEFTFSSYFS